MLANALRKNAHRLPKGLQRFLGNLWPPFLFAGIHIDRIAHDYREIDVSLPLRWYNKNYVGTHFGGSLYSMTDPFFMIILIQNLGPEYIVWDKAARIEFKKPGRGRVHARFFFTEHEIAEIKAKANSEEKYVFDRSIDVFNAEGEVVASVLKTLYVRKKSQEKK